MYNVAKTKKEMHGHKNVDVPIDKIDWRILF